MLLDELAHTHTELRGAIGENAGLAVHDRLGQPAHRERSAGCAAQRRLHDGQRPSLRRRGRHVDPRPAVELDLLLLGDVSVQRDPVGEAALGDLRLERRAVVAIAGDGGFVVNVGELATAVQENVAVVVVLFNDGGYGVLRNIQNRSMAGRHIGVDLRAPDLVRLAEAFGAWACRVQAVRDFRPALEAALEANRPALIEVDMAAIGPPAVPFGGPPSGS